MGVLVGILVGMVVGDTMGLGVGTFVGDIVVVAVRVGTMVGLFDGSVQPIAKAALIICRTFGTPNPVTGSHPVVAWNPWEQQTSLAVQ